MVNPDDCKLTRYPAEVLAGAAKPVEEVNDDIRRIADQMIDMMLKNKGIGLAGPQAGVGLRMFVVSLDGTKENARVYINPTITPDGQLEPMEEGCLSLPGIYAKVRRYKKCAIKATGLDGKEFTEEAEGMLARVFQHECDHLEGTMIIDRIGEVAKIGLRGRLKELKKKLSENEKYLKD
jgi:peptide deformylase